MICLLCSKETSNPKFCSRSCAATFTNKQSPKRKRTHFCKVCKESILYGRKYCVLCRPAPIEKLSNTSLIEVYNRLSVKDKHPSWKNSIVREHCRDTNKHLHKVCQKCGYSIHTELCHIKAVSSFAETSLLKDVNAEDNILVLCRNHHWEFDHGFLKLEDIPKRN